MRNDLSLPPDLSFVAPEEALRKARAAMAPIRPERLFNQPKYQPLLEQWSAGWFGVAYGTLVRPCEVAMNPKESSEADFFLRQKDHVPRTVFSFQNVEVQEPGRRRGDEYRRPGLRPYRPGRGGIEGPSWLEAGVRRKLGKRYAGARQLNVLVYLNFSGQELEFADVARALEPYRGEFASVWVMAHHIIGAVFSTPELGMIGGWTLIPGAHDD